MDLLTLGQPADTDRVDPRRWWLLAATVLALCACAAAAVQPSLARAGDGILLLGGVGCAVLLWRTGSRYDHRLRGWRLIALSPLLVASGALLTVVVAPADPIDGLLLRWAPAVPGYALAIAGGLTLVDRDPLRGRGPRVLVELALFTTAGVVAMQLLFLGPGQGWTDLAAPERLVFGA